MAPDLRPGPHSPPTDELHSAEDTLGVLQRVLHTVAADDLSRPTPCADFDVAQLTGHLLNSIKALGGMVGADVPEPAEGDSVSARWWPRRGRRWTPGTGTGWAGRCRSARARCPPRARAPSCRSNSWCTPGITRPRRSARSTPPSRCPNTCWAWPATSSGRSYAGRRIRRPGRRARGRRRPRAVGRFHRPQPGAIVRSSALAPSSVKPGLWV